MEGRGEEGRNVICQLRDPEGNPLGAPISLPHSIRPNHLQLIINQLLANEEMLPYAFYICDRELLVELGLFLRESNASLEQTVQIVYQPQAIFRIAPVYRCSATLSGHKDAVLVVKFSPDGRHLATGSGDTSVRLWDLNTQSPQFTCQGHKNSVLCIAWSPDGKYLVSGSKAGEIMCWDPHTGEPLGKPLLGHRNWTTDISWEPLHLQAPCRRFVSASKDGDARVWDVVLKRCVMCLSGHTLSVTCVKWGGDGVIYTGSQDCTIKVWDTKQGKLIRELKGHAHWVNTLSLNTDHALRTGAFGHKGTQYDNPDEAKEAALEIYNKVRGNTPERLLSGSDDFSMYLWEPLVNKHHIFQLIGHRKLVNSVGFSPDGLWLASGSFDHSVKLWNSRSGKFVHSFQGHVSDVHQICWSADSRFLVSASKDSTVKVWDIRKRVLKHDLPGPSDEVYAVDWSPNGEKVASGSKDKRVRIYMG